MRTLPQAVSLLLSLLLCAPAPGQSPLPQQVSTAKRPDPKKSQKFAEIGDKALAAGRFDEALAAYTEAVRLNPQDEELVEKTFALRSKLVRTLVDAAERDALAGQMNRAAEELGAALEVDPGNKIVQERYAQFHSMIEDESPRTKTPLAAVPHLKPQKGKKNLNLRGDTKAVYEQLAALFGVKVTFDPDLQPKQGKLQVDDVDFVTAASLLEAETGTFWRPVDATLMFVAQDTTEKRRQYGLEAEQTFLLSAAASSEEVTELLRILRDITGSTRMNIDTSTRSITMRDTPEHLAMTGELIQQLERARGELMLEMEILEVDKDKARSLGITPPASTDLIALSTPDLNLLKSSTTLTNLLTNIQQVFAAKGFSSIPSVVPVGGGHSTFLLTLPTGAANFSDSLSLVQSGRQVLMRAQNGKPASFFVGDRFPVTLSLLSGSTGNASATLTGLPASTTFPENSYTVGRNPSALVAGNFTGGTLSTGNSLLELAVANRNDNSITVLKNEDVGSFVAEANSPFLLPPTASGPAALAQGFLRNKTGAGLTPSQTPDLVVVNANSNNVTVLLSSADANGNLIFTEATGSPYSVGNSPGAIVLADFNGDGNLDFAVTNTDDNTVSVFAGDGTGGFAEFVGSPYALGGTLAINSTSLPAATVSAQYFQPAVVAGGVGARTWSISAGALPAGLTIAPATGIISGTPTLPGIYNFTVTVTDSAVPPNSTATPLGLIVNAATPAFAIANSLGNGSIGTSYNEILTTTGGKAPFTWSIASGALPTGLSLNATSGAIVGNPSKAGSATFTVQVVDSSATPQTAQQQFTMNPSNATARGPVALATANFRNSTLSNANNASSADLAVVNEGSNNVSILLDTVDTSGNLSFPAPATGSPIAVGTTPVAIAAGDLNSDGVADLAVVNQASASVTVLLGSSNLDGTFTQATGSPLQTSSNPAGIVIAAFASGLAPALAVTNNGVNTIGVYLGLGQGTFASRIELNTPAGPTALIAAPLTSSGLPDVALVSQDPNATDGEVTVIQDSTNLANSSTVGLAQTPYPGSEYVDLGVKIKATPTMHPNNEVTLVLEFEIRALSGSSVNGIPIISNRSLSHTVRVKEDEPTLIGGITDLEETRSISGLPGFAEIPVIGYAFGKRSSSSQDTELLIIITPRKLRMIDYLTKAIYAGRGEPAGSPGRGPAGPFPNPPTPGPTPTPPQGTPPQGTPPATPPPPVPQPQP